MKAYLLASGGAFGLVVLAHLMRVIVEGTSVARDPTFIVATIAATAMCLWAIRLLRVLPRT